MASKTITTKFGTKINVDGLTPQQIAKVRSTAEDNGAYGAKGAALADSFRKQAVKPTGKGGKGTNLGINPKTGQINPTVATNTVMGAAEADANNTFETMNPGSQTDALGNTQNITRDPVTGKTSISQTGGAAVTAANNAFVGAATGLGGDGRKVAQDANYNYITRNYARDKAREMEEAKQELAQRGIPIDPSPNSLWSRTVGGIDQKYSDLDMQAQNQAITSGNERYATDVSAVSALGGTVNTLTPNFTQYQGGGTNQAGNLQQLLGTISQADLAKYGIDQDTMLKLKQIAASQNRGGGGGGGDSGPFIGGVAP